MADSSVAITAGSGTPIRVLTGLGTASADQQVVTLADSSGNLLGTTAAPVPVTDPDASASGTITATDAVVATPAGDGALLTGTPTASSFVGIALTGGDSGWVLQLSGTFGSGTVYFEASFDGGTTYIPVNGRQSGLLATNLTFSTTTAGIWRGNLSAATNFRARIKGATSPSVAVTIRTSAGTAATFLNAALPAGTNFIGKLRLSNSTVDAEVTAGSSAALASYPALVVGLSPNSPLPAGTNVIGTAVQSPILPATATNTVVVNATPGATGTIGHAAATITAAVTTAAAFIAAPAAGLSIYITDINVTNSGASATLVSLFAAGQTVPLAAKFVAATTSAPPTSLRTPIRVGTATALNYTNSVASTSVFVQVTYYIAA